MILGVCRPQLRQWRLTLWKKRFNGEEKLIQENRCHHHYHHHHHHHRISQLIGPSLHNPILLFIATNFCSTFCLQKDDSADKEALKAAGEVDACTNPSNGEVIPAPFRLSGFLVCNVPIVAAMLFTNSVYIQVSNDAPNFPKTTKCPSPPLQASILGDVTLVNFAICVEIARTAGGIATGEGVYA